MNKDELNQASENIDETRRSLLKASYVAPAIVTLSAIPSFASAGSSRASRIQRYRNLSTEQKISLWKRWISYIKDKYGS